MTKIIADKTGLVVAVHKVKHDDPAYRFNYDAWNREQDELFKAQSAARKAKSDLEAQITHLRLERKALREQYTKVSLDRRRYNKEKRKNAQMQLCMAMVEIDERLLELL